MKDLIYNGEYKHLRIDPLTKLPVISSVYHILEEKLKELERIGFLYFDISNYKYIETTYGVEFAKKILSIIGDILRDFWGRVFRKEDLIVAGTLDSDYFVTFLFSPPRHKKAFTNSDLTLTSLRIINELKVSLKERLEDFDFKEEIEFHTGHTIIEYDSKLPIERIIYEAHKEAALKSRLEQIIAEFVSNISHELKTPITCIKGYVETLLEGAIEDKDTAIRFLNIINDETNRLYRLINDLLDLSLIESRKITMKIDVGDIKPLILDVINLLTPYAENKKINLNFVNKDEIFPLVLMDEDRIQQVLINLIDNAIKYSPSNSNIDIFVETDVTSIKVNVRDYGIGIKEEDLEKVFDRFYRVGKDRSQASGGRGLGLAIAKKIIEAHNGEIGVESKYKHGATFYFTLNIALDQ